MDTGRGLTLMARWSLLTAGLIALFWGVWYAVAGSVPSVSEIKMTGTWTIELPFTISRWWDIALGPIVSSLATFIMTSNAVRTDKDGRAVLVFRLVYALAVGLIAGLIFGLGYGLVYALGVGLVFGLFFVLILGLVVGLVFGRVVGLGYGLGYGLGAGLGYGLVVGLGIGLVYALGVGLGYGFKKLYSLSVWHQSKTG